MKLIENKTLLDERALFKSDDIKVLNCIFDEGESPLKESKNFIVDSSKFIGRYPLWYDNNISIYNTYMDNACRAPIWYTNKILIDNCNINSPKAIRNCSDITIINTTFNKAEELMWVNDNAKLENVNINESMYFGYRCSNVNINNMNQNGKYSFDSCSNLYLNNCHIVSKDIFWNGKDITIENSSIVGEYIGWNSDNVTFKNCYIESHQGFCYMKNLKMDNCTINKSDLVFEYCENVDITLINSHLESIKNVLCGTINLIDSSVDEIIRDDKDIDHSKTHIYLIDSKTGSKKEI